MAVNPQLKEREKQFASSFNDYLLEQSIVKNDFKAGGATTATIGKLEKATLDETARQLPMAGSLFKTGYDAVRSSFKREENKIIYAVLPQEIEIARVIYIYAAVKLFRVFECQFSNVAAVDNDLNGKRAMSKLAEDAACRVLNYIINLSETEIKNLFSCQLFKSPVKGSDFIFNAALLGYSEKGRTVVYKYEEGIQKMNTAELFDTSGYITFNKNGNITLHELKNKNKAQKYGYKQKLDCDILYGTINWNIIEYNGDLQWVSPLQKTFIEYNYQLSLEERSIEMTVNEIVKRIEGKEIARKNDVEKVDESVTKAAAIASEILSDVKYLKDNVPRTLQRSNDLELWRPLIGRSLPRITPDVFLKLRVIEKCDSLVSQFLIKELLPTVTQTLKMWGIWILYPYTLAQFRPKEETKELPQNTMSALERMRARKTNTEKPTVSKHSLPLSRIDVITSLINCCTGITAEDLLSMLSQFPVSLPLIIPWIDHEEEFLMLIPWLQSISFKWETNEKIINQNFLFTSPFRLITAVRIGNASVGKPGKSCILNRLFSSNYLFSSSSEPGAEYGKPVSLPGFVEFVALTQETCEESLWSEALENQYKQGNKDIVLLANLHGNPLDYPETINVLQTLKSIFIVFILEKDVDVAFDQLQEFINLTGENISEDFILAIDSELGFEDNNVIDTTTLLNDTTLEKVRNVIKGAIENSRPCTYHSALFENISEKNISIATPIETPQSLQLATYVQKKSCKTVKKLFQLQQIRTRDIKDYKIHNNIWYNGKDLQHLINMFCEVLLLPLEERRLAISHLYRTLSNISNEESAKCRNEIASLKKQNRQTLNLEGQEKILHANEEKIVAAYKNLDSMNLGLEHLFRELGKVYEIMLSEKKSEINKYPLCDLLKCCSELLLDGTAVELLDGDIEDINKTWFNAICNQIHLQYPKLKVFVVSILGLQSSGKSTLLNALFGCKFSVSAGRCTRGIFMRLVFLEEKLSKEIGVDALILLDTEGLGAPEKMADKDADRKDRLMATFAMSISDLTIINVLGESLSTLKEILQIVIVTMARLDKADMAPDILMVQHGCERDSSKQMAGADAFCAALQDAFALVKKNVVELGTFEAKSLERVAQRVNIGNVLRQFRAFKNGATANAPPSHEYHEDVVNLYKDILDCGKNMGKVTHFNTWHQLIPGYWEEVLSEKFSSNFKNLQEMEDFIYLGKKIAEVKQYIDLAFREHGKKLETLLNIGASSALHNTDNSTQDWESTKLKLLENAEIILTKVPATCNSENSQSCNFCKTASRLSSDLLVEYKDQHSELEIEDTFKKYTTMNKDSAIHQVKQMASALEVKFGKFSEFEAFINSMLKSKLAENRKYDYFERETIVTNIWNSLCKTVSDKNRTINVISRIEHQVAQVYKTSQILNQTFRSMEYRRMNSIEGLQLGTMQSRMNYFVGMRNTRLNANQCDEISSFLRTLPLNILKKQSAEIFDNWMVADLQREIEIYLAKFQIHHNVIIKPNLKIVIHQNGLRLFSKIMEEKEDAWKLKNDPLTILLNKEMDYKKQIDIRLQYGFDIDGEGRLMGNVLLKAIRAVSQNAGDRYQIESVMSQPWILNSENIRLTYFDMLATEIEIGNKGPALEYFGNRKSMIEQWFIEKVDSLEPHSAEKEFRATAESELNRLKRIISKQTSCQFIEGEILSYCQPAGIEYKCAIQFDESSDADLLKEIILKVLNNDGNSVCENISIKKASQDDMVMRRLGCTESCFWCGALCWGARSHDEDADETKRHHTAHQPRGLARVSNKDSKHLITYSCDQMADDCYCYWGEHWEGTLWKDARIHPDFQNWNFSEHSKKQFSQLMRWFFFQLHTDIAQIHGLLPVPDTVLDEQGFTSLQLQPILSDLRSRI